MSAAPRPVQLSVVLTVYNTNECLSQCLDDLIAQTYSDFELICIDDGSSDGSTDTLAQYAKRFENAGISYAVKRQDNAGPAAARNAGINMAKGEFLMLLDSDDRFEPSLLERMTTRMLNTGADIAVCRADEFIHGTDHRRPADWSIRADLLPKRALSPEGTTLSAEAALGCPFTAFMGWPWDKIYRLGFIQQERLRFPEDLPNAEDFPFVYLALCRARGIAVIDEVLIHHRVKRSSSTSNSRLSDPFSFYRGIEMLKSELQCNPAQWAKLEWGFLNWALHYTCWNIESLPAGAPERAQLIAALLDGSMPALELDQHPPAYFSMHADDQWCLRRLAAESKTGHPAKKSPWEYISVASNRMGSIGLGALAQQAKTLLQSR